MPTHGSSPSCFIPSDTRFFSVSNLSTFAVTSSPTLSTSEGCFTRRQARSVMCSRPSMHITDLAWRRVKHPSEVLNVGDEVTAKVLKFDTEKNRVSLGLKQLGEDPWVGLSRRYPTGTRLFGKVTNLTDYGAFVEVE